jgi:hypothetical protein
MPLQIVPAKHTFAIMIEWLIDELVIREMTDAELLAAYERTDGASAEARRLLAGIERRGLDL